MVGDARAGAGLILLRPGVTDFVHIGLVVEDLDETVRFLALLGFDCGEPGVVGGGGSIGSSVSTT